MLEGLNALARELAPEGEREGRSTHAATVVRVDAEGIVWVSIPGGARETPCLASLASARPGDVVQVAIDGNRATLVGNASRPSTDDTAAIAASERAVEASATAQQALEDAVTAALAAARATRSADEAQASAELAGEQAEAATESARSANVSASNALRSLSEVEDVVGTLGWIAEHGTYAPTADTAPVEGKVYYTRTGSGTDADPYAYAPVPEPSAEGIGGYSYAPTEDEEVDPSKTYYALNGETGGYEAVEEPTDEDIGSYFEQSWEPAYWELSLSESVNSYVASHLALTDEGLSLFGRSGYRAVLTPTGLEIRDAENAVVGRHGENVLLGRESDMHVLLANSLLAFLNGSGERIAYIGEDDDGQWRMFIHNATVTSNLKFGDYVWTNRSNGNMTLKYIGEEE